MKAIKAVSTLSPKCCVVSWWKLLTKMSQNRVRSSGSLANYDDIVKSGYLKKLKTLKKKFFVLRRETGPDSHTRLEYYDSEKKFKTGAQPKKPILLRTCISINRKKDPKHNYVIALYTNHGSVSMAADSEAELTDWLGFLHHHMHQAVAGSDGQSRKLYEHAWLVEVQPRSLGSSKGITGEHHICLTYKSIALVRVGDGQKKIEFPLNSIRRCGHTGSFFFLGLGRSAVTGAGDIWMLTEDSVIAENMHSTIRKAMHDPCNNISDDPVSRERTQSMSNQRSFESGGHRMRCGSMPSRSRTSSEGSVQTGPNKLQPNCSHQLDGPVPSLCPHQITRPKSMYSTSLTSCSPPCAPALFSPSSSESMESAASVDDNDGHHSYTPEKAMDNSGCGYENYMKMEVGSLPISNFPHSLSLVSPVSGNTTEDPCPENSGYLPMAPLNSPGSNFPTWPSLSSSQVSSPPHSANHSRIPSLVDESTDDYYSMVPGSQMDTTASGDSQARDRSRSYLDMTPTPAAPIPYSPSDGMLQHRGGGDSFPEMSPGSSSSFTSGTPSSDHRFPDFITEKGAMGPYCGYSEDDDSSLDRPIRTNSVGSKPEQFRSRKNRLEVSPAEPARVRAFSVGSRVSLRLGGGRSGQVASGATAHFAPGTEFTPSIKEKGKQVKSKSSSAPILGTSPVSKSWSGTPGTFFRSFLQARNQERNNDLMEFDFTKNKSCDSISSEKEKKSSSVESFKRTITGQRNRSNSKSSGNGKPSVFDSFKRDKKKSESELSAKGMEIPEGKSAFEMEFTPSPRGSAPDVIDGYMPMNISKPINTPANSEYLEMSSKDFFRGHSFADPYLNMSKSNDRLVAVSTLSTSGPNDGYVDMSQGKGSLTPISSSPATSNSSSSIGARVRKISSTFNPLSSQDFTSQQDEYVPIDLRGSCDSSHSLDGEKSKKKKNGKRKSFKESTKRKKSEPIAVIGQGNDTECHEGTKKGTSPLSSITTLLGRKNSSGTPPKTPLSPTGSPLPKSSRGTPSPFSSLTRNKNRDKEVVKDGMAKENSGGNPSHSSGGIGTSCIKESSREAEESAISGDSRLTSSSPGITSSSPGITSSSPGITSSSPCITSSSSCITSSSPGITSSSPGITSSSPTVPSNGEHLSKPSSISVGSKRTSGIFEPSSQADSRQDEKQKAAGSESINISISDSSQPPAASKSSGDMGAYVNLTPGSSDKNLGIEIKQRKVSTGSISEYMKVSPMSASRTPEAAVEVSQSHNYVNMCPGGKPDPPVPLSNLSASGPTGGSVSPKRKTSVGSRSEDSEKSSPSLGYGGSRDQNRRDSKRLSGSHFDEGDGSGGESGYLLMTPGQPPVKPLSPLTAARKPDIPASLLGGLERLNLGTSPSSASSERCRSHSGPGAPESSAVGTEVRVKKQLSEPRAGAGMGSAGGRAASACSSPVSYSPPTSPTLGGSVSSVSSLSEGGMSSASSTCTVVNVGIARREGALPGATRAHDTHPDSTYHTMAATPASQGMVGCAMSGGLGDGALNYVSLDLAPARCEGVMPSPRAGRRNPSGGSSGGAPPGPQEAVAGEDDEPLSYAQIDFTKSEGLRTTSLSRDHRH